MSRGVGIAMESFVAMCLEGEPDVGTFAETFAAQYDRREPDFTARVRETLQSLADELAQTRLAHRRQTLIETADAEISGLAQQLRDRLDAVRHEILQATFTALATDDREAMARIEPLLEPRLGAQDAHEAVTALTDLIFGAWGQTTTPAEAHTILSTIRLLTALGDPA